MGAALFYHLTGRPLEATAPVLLAKALEQGWRVAVRGRDRARLEWLDEALWMGREDSFLPHGIEGGPQDALQPILLCEGVPANDPKGLMCFDGAEVSAEEIERFERVWILFDGRDSVAVERARGQWRALTGAGCKAQYWSEDQGRWEKKAES